MITVKVFVTKENINKGKPKNEKCCSLALALSETLKKDVEVNKDCVKIYDLFPGYNHYALLPATAKKAIWQVDHKEKEKVVPFSFDISLPERNPYPNVATNRAKLVPQT